MLGGNKDLREIALTPRHRRQSAAISAVHRLIGKIELIQESGFKSEDSEMFAGAQVCTSVYPKGFVE